MMTRCWRRAISTALLAFAFGAAYGQGRSADRTVSAADLENGTLIIGHLGVPLGELASIKGTIRVTNTKESDKILEIAVVNGRSLSRVIQMKFSIWPWGNIAYASLPINEVISLRVYETGGMVGIPIEAMQETTFVQTVSWGFSTSLVLLKLD